MSTPRRDAGDAAAGAAGLSAEEVEALRQMHEEVSRQLPDRRSEGDSQWLANGAQVELHSLQKAQQLNGQRGEIVGFDDKQLRYRVRLHSDNSVKVVAKKNMRLLTYEDLQLPDVPDTARTAGLATAGSSTASGTPPAAPVTREVVVKAIDRVKRDVLALQQRIAVRRAGGTAEATPDMSDIFMRLTASEEMCKEVMEMYQRSHGRDEELDLHAATALEASEACVQEYTEVRSWQEYFQDEVNVTKYNVQKHGILGTLKNEVVEVGQDVRDLGQSATEVIGTHAPQVPHLVRKATGTVSEAVQSGTAAATSTGRSFAARSQEHITNVVHESVVAPVKRAWHFLVFGFLLCFLVPLFALRTYAPFNTVVSNMGVLWLAVCTCCPPRGMHRRAAKAALILLYPLVTVALPLGLHYWATHPQFAEDVSSALRQLPSAVTRTVQSVRPNHCDAPPEPKVLPAAPAAAPAAPAPVPPAAAAERKEVEEDTDRNPKPGFLRWLTTLFHRFHPKPRQTAFVPAVGYTGQWATIQHPRPRRLRRNTIFEHESRGNGIGQ